jgi:predicted RNA-binding Zn-ribbon protein involved in translation (DUF1610 family)
MTATCDTCDGTVTAKNAAGHFRDTCPDCCQAVADARTPASAHDCADCGDPAVGRPDGTWLCAGCWVDD